jgi:hypothetical protein
MTPCLVWYVRNVGTYLPVNTKSSSKNNVFIHRVSISDVINFFLGITNKMQRYTIPLFLQNALHVSGGPSAHHQELKNCTYSIWYLLSRYCYRLLSRKVAVTA